MKTTISLSATPILFHITSQAKAANIMQKDRFELKPSDGTSAEEDLASASYYLSTTRSKLGAYTRRTVHTNSAILVLNGTAIAHRYRVLPVDYWGAWQHEDAKMRTERDEAEDRVLSARPWMPARRYVLEVHAHVGESGEHSRRNAVLLKRTCLLKKVPVFFYQSVEDLLLMDKRKAVPLDLKMPALTEEPYQHSREYQQARMKERRHNSLRGWIELAMTPVPAEYEAIVRKVKTLSRYAEMAYKRLQYSDALSGLNADMHNAKSVPYDQPRGERESLDKLVALLRKRKQSVGQFIAALRQKWYQR